MPDRPHARPGRLAAWATVLALALPGAAAALDGWKPFHPSDDAFVVALPTPPTTQRKERWFPISDFVSTVYTSRVGHDAFGLNHTDLPRMALFFAPTEKIFDSARKGFLEDSNATEISFDETEFEGRSARELVYDIPPAEDRPALRGKARMFFEKNRLYIIWAEVTDAVTPGELDRYFSSLRIGKRDD
jgi:hypothetical protein